MNKKQLGLLIVSCSLLIAIIGIGFDLYLLNSDSITKLHLVYTVSNVKFNGTWITLTITFSMVENESFHCNSLKDADGQIIQFSEHTYFNGDSLTLMFPSSTASPGKAKLWLRILTDDNETDFPIEFTIPTSS